MCSCHRPLDADLYAAQHCIAGQRVDTHMLAALSRSGIPILVLGGAIECNDPIGKELR